MHFLKLTLRFLGGLKTKYVVNSLLEAFSSSKWGIWLIQERSSNKTKRQILYMNAYINTEIIMSKFGNYVQ